DDGHAVSRRRRWGSRRHEAELMPRVHSAAAGHRDRLILVFLLTLSVFVIEVVGGVLSNSLALVADAGHLFAVSAYVLYEAWRRLQEPPEVTSGLMLAVAILGLAANAVSLFLLRNAHQESLNARGAYLEVMGDLAGSVAVIVAAVVIATT